MGIDRRRLAVGGNGRVVFLQLQIGVADRRMHAADGGRAGVLLPEVDRALIGCDRIRVVPLIELRVA